MRSRFLTIVLLFGLLSLAIVPAASADLPAPMSWVKYGTAPVVACGVCGVDHPTRPAVLVESHNNYKMYFTRHPGDNGAQIYLATTGDGGTTWTCYSTTPVLTVGPSAWDDTRVTTPTVIKEPGVAYRMWYTGRNSTGTNAIGYATSPDGFVWTKYGTTPVLTAGAPGTWDSQMVREPAVVKVGDTYHMWYAGTDRWPYFKIGHATSTNGFTWIKDADPVLSPGGAGDWDAYEVFAPSVVWNDPHYEMFYSGNAGQVWLTGHATSTDGTHWTKDDNAIISPEGLTAWDSGDSTDYVAAVLDDGTWKVFYSGASGSYQIGLATLKDEPQLTFDELATNVLVGTTREVYIDLTAVKNLYGYQFEVHYGAGVTAMAASFDNTFFDTAGGFPVWDADFSDAGVVKFAVSKQRSAGDPVTGSGPLAKITFRGDSAGLARLWFENDILADRNGGVLANSRTVGWLDVYGTATLKGVVSLQGRATPLDDGTVKVYTTYGYPPVSVSFSGTDGKWTATVPVDPEGTCDIVAAHGLYLSNLKSAVPILVGGTVDLGTTTLKGGDANNDGVISVSDLSCIGGDFDPGLHACGLTHSDINLDGKVNILDLVLAGGNYGLASPQPWTP